MAQRHLRLPYAARRLAATRQERELVTHLYEEGHQRWWRPFRTSLRLLAEYSGVRAEDVRRLLTDLEDGGFILWTRGDRSSKSEVRVVDPMELPDHLPDHQEDHEPDHRTEQKKQPPPPASERREETPGSPLGSPAGSRPGSITRDQEGLARAEIESEPEPDHHEESEIAHAPARTEDPPAWAEHLQAASEHLQAMGVVPLLGTLPPGDVMPIVKAAQAGLTSADLRLLSAWVLLSKEDEPAFLLKKKFTWRTLLGDSQARWLASAREWDRRGRVDPAPASKGSPRPGRKPTENELLRSQWELGAQMRAAEEARLTPEEKAARDAELAEQAREWEARRVALQAAEDEQGAVRAAQAEAWRQEAEVKARRDRLFKALPGEQRLALLQRMRLEKRPLPDLLDELMAGDGATAEQGVGA